MPLIDSETKFTQIYWDVPDDVLKPYIRLLPDMLDVGHGMSLGKFYDNEEQCLAEQEMLEEQIRFIFQQFHNEVVRSCQEHLLTSTDRYRKEYFAGKLDDLII